MRDQSSLLGSEFYMERGLIYRNWVPPSQDEDIAVEQLVLPIYSEQNHTETGPLHTNGWAIGKDQDC